MPELLFRNHPIYDLRGVNLHSQKCISLIYHQKLPNLVILTKVSTSLSKMAFDELSQNVTFHATETDRLMAHISSQLNTKQAILCICQFLTNVVSVR